MEIIIDDYTINDYRKIKMNNHRDVIPSEQYIQGIIATEEGHVIDLDKIESDKKEKEEERELEKPEDLELLIKKYLDTI